MKDKIKLLMMVGLFALNGVSGAMIPGAPVPPAPHAHVHPGHNEDYGFELSPNPTLVAVQLEEIYNVASEIQKGEATIEKLNNCINLSTVQAIQSSNRAIRDSLIDAGYFLLDTATNTVSIAPNAPQITKEAIIQAYDAYAREHYCLDKSVIIELSNRLSNDDYNRLLSAMRTTGQALKDFYERLLDIQGQHPNRLTDLNNYINMNTIPTRMQNLRRAVRDSLVNAGYLVLNGRNNVSIAPGAPQITKRGMIRAYHRYALDNYGIGIGLI